MVDIKDIPITYPKECMDCHFLRELVRDALRDIEPFDHESGLCTFNCRARSWHNQYNPVHADHCWINRAKELVQVG